MNNYIRSCALLFDNVQKCLPLKNIVIANKSFQKIICFYA